MCGIFAGSPECALAMRIVSMIYCFLFLGALIGAIIFWKHKKQGWAIWWLSTIINVFTFLSLLGAYGNLAYIMQVLVMIIWPIINVAWLLDLIRSERRFGKNKKKKLFGIF